MFKTQNFCHIASNNRNQVKVGVFVYRTTDSLATVSASGYFNERIIDLKLHDIIIHEQIDASDATKVKQNFLCVVERTLTNTKVKIMDTDEVDGANTALSNLTATGKANISKLGTYNESNTYSAGTVGAAIKGKVNIDGSSVMTGPLKFRAGSFEGAIAGGLGDGISIYKLKSDNTIDSEVASLTKTNGFIPGTTNTMNIGSNNLRWKTVYANSLNGCAIPNKDGTLARIEDINYTNCITQVPQNINISLSNGTLTLKTGSKVYVPNGSGVFDTIVLSADKTATDTGTRTLMCFYNGTYIEKYPVEYCYAGNTAPSGHTHMFWYDTANNMVKNTTDGGSTWTGGWSLPFAIVTATGTITSIDNVFNGIGYIGPYDFRLPGLTGVSPDGRNADGTFKNKEWTLTSVMVNPTAGGSGNFGLFAGSGITRNQDMTYYYKQPEEPTTTNQYAVWYDTRNNYLYTTNDTGATWNKVDYTLLAIEHTTAGVVDGFIQNTVFSAVDSNDTDFIAHQSMPSAKYIDLTLGTSGSQYTAPADGYFTITKGAGAAGEYIYMRNTDNSMNIGMMATSASNCRICVPVSRAQHVNVTYSLTGATATFRFIYANGVK